MLPIIYTPEWKEGLNVNSGLVLMHMYLNSSPPSDIYMRQWIGSALVQIVSRHHAII